MELKDNEEIKKIDILLDHWVKHNREHASEYKKWADKLKGEKFKGISRHLERASELVKQSNQEFVLAKEKMKDIK